jgi:phosphatidylinositol alpha-1,6-mannosyltransferase
MLRAQGREFKSRHLVPGSDESHMSVQGVSNPKILLITNDFGPRAGGIETFVMGLLERMDPGSTLVYTSSQNGADVHDKKWQEAHDVRVFRDRSRILLPTPRVIRAISRIIEKENVTHLWFGAAAPLALMTPFLKRRKIALRAIALTHGHEVWWAKIPPFSTLMRIIAGSLDALGYLTRYTKAEISKGVRQRDRKKLVHIAPGIDLHHFSPINDDQRKSEIRSQLGLDGKQIIISVGRLVHRKGQDRLIESIAHLRAEFPEVHLLLVGEGPDRERLESIARRNEVRDAITFVGRLQLDQLPLYLSIAEIFAMPSRDRLAGLEVEGLGIVYLEASGCGLPIIVGRSGGAPDAVIDGETGLIVDGEDTDSIAEACAQLLRDPSRARAMGFKGREWVTSQWSWDRWAAEFRAALLR